MNADRNEIQAVQDHMNDLMYKEELMWLQRSRIDWLREGDRNTKFFHQRAMWRARKNKVKFLIDDSGARVEKKEKMGDLVDAYFQSLFTCDNALVQAPLVQLVQPKVTDEMNLSLCADFTDKEISDSLFQIGPLKAPGSDGFPARFFQRNWLVLKEEVLCAVKEFFRT